MDPKLVLIYGGVHLCLEIISFAVTTLSCTNIRELKHWMCLPHLPLIIPHRGFPLRQWRHPTDGRLIHFTVNHVIIRYFILDLYNTVNLTAINTYMTAIAAGVFGLLAFFFGLPVEGEAVAHLFEG